MSERKAKLTIKVGDRSVEFEAGVDRVEAELHRLAAELLGSGRGREGDEPAVLSVTAPRRPAPAGEAESARSGGTGAFPEKAVPASPSVAELMRHAKLDRREVARLYAAGKSGTIRLRALPETGRDSQGDTLLLVLYGMLVLRGRAPSTAPALLKGARASGLMLKRASRALEGKSRLVSRSGLRRGMRYRLTRDGVEHCETLIPRLLPLL